VPRHGLRAAVKNGPTPSELAADAHACIMVNGSLRSTGYKVAARVYRCPDSELPSDTVIPITTSVPTCSALSRLGLETIERRSAQSDGWP
jgi:hypothetical protein